MALLKLDPQRLAAERDRYAAELQHAIDPEARRLAETRLAEIDAELARRNGRANGVVTTANRWPQVDLRALIAESGCRLHQKTDHKWVGDHAPKHGSRSGECLVVWPRRGYWACTSCKERGDAAGWIAHLEGIPYAEAAKKLEARFGKAPSAYDDLPWIDAEQQDLRIVTAEAWTALELANAADPTLFRYGGLLVRLERDDHGHLAPVELNPDRLRHVLARVANWYKQRDVDDGNGPRKVRHIVRPPGYVVQDILATPDPPLPILRRIVEVPVFGPGGELQTTPGYHAESRAFYDPAHGVTLPEVPEHPTADDVRRARSLLLDELLIDFPFVSEADRAHAVALFLLPFVRDLIDGPTPLHLVEAPTEGSGKGLLAEVCLIPAVGRRFGSMTAGRTVEEWRKAITSTLKAGHSVVWIDNVVHPIDSGDLASALTAHTWEDRVLGKSELVRLPVRCAWVCTANNPTVSREMMRRTIRIRIDPKQDMPWLRDGFKHPRLRQWTWEHRGELVWAGLVLTRFWLSKGKPAPKVKPLGSYEAWSEVIGGILESVGIAGFLSNLSDFYAVANTEASAWRAFVAAWWEKYESEPVLAKKLLPLALEIDALEIRGKDEAAQARSLGKKLERQRDRVIGDYRIERAGTDRTNVIRWRLQKIDGSTGNPAIPANPARPGDGDHGDLGGDAGFAGNEGFSTLTGENARAGECPGCGFPLPDGAAYCSEQCRALAERPDPDDDPPPTTPPRPYSNEKDRQDGLSSTTVGTVGTGAPPVEYRLLTDATAVQEALPVLLDAPCLGFDVETTGLDPHADRLRLVQLAVPNGPTYIIDCFAVDPRVLAPVFERATLVGHNLKFDLRFLLAAGLPVPDGKRLFDTILAAQLLDAGLPNPGHGLDDLARRFLGVELPKDLQGTNWAGRLSPAMLEYAARDAAIVLPLRERLQAEIAGAKLERVSSLEFRALPAVAWLEHSGAPFDTDAWRALADAALLEKLRLADELTDLAEALLGKNNLFGREVNWESAPQVLRLLREAGLDLPNTAEEALQAHRDHPLVARLLAFREAARRCGAHGLNVLGDVHPVTGRIHADWHQIGAASGRMSCTRPNLQNVPRTPAYRACFKAPEGRVLVKADYSQIELRIAAEIAGDRRMLDAYRRGEDLHALTARLVLGKQDVTKADRQAAKALNFGLIYGMGAATLRQHAASGYGVHLTPADAARFRAAFFRAYPGLRAWHRSQPEGEIETRTLAGRRRLNVARYTEKLNTPVQGTGADGLKAALALLWETRARCPSAIPVLAVHDEVVIECDATEAETAREWLTGCLRRGMAAFIRRVPVEVEATVCRDWSGTPVGEEFEV